MKKPRTWKAWILLDVDGVADTVSFYKSDCDNNRVARSDRVVRVEIREVAKRARKGGGK